MRITNTKSDTGHPLKMLIFGEPGAGKTYLAGTITEPTLLISAESGLLTLKDKAIDVIDISQDDKGEIVPKEKRVDRLKEVYSYLVSPEARAKYKWVFIDSLTEISQNLMEQLNQEFPERKDSLVMYGENNKRMRSIVKGFRDLPYYNIVFTALSAIDKDENGVRFTTIDLVGSFSNKLPAFFDEVFYLYCDKDGKRILVTEKSEKLVVKDRSGMLEKFEEPNLSLIAKKINSKATTVNGKATTAVSATTIVNATGMATTTGTKGQILTTVLTTATTNKEEKK